MLTLKLRLLGPPCVEIDDQPVTFSRRKSLALLVYLAVSGEAQQRDTLAMLLWPDHAQGQARGLLRRELSSLRLTLGHTWLAAARDQITLRANQHQHVWLDVRLFETLLDTKAEASPSLAALASAINLYRGDFLSGFTLDDSPNFDDWQFFHAEEYRRSLLQALDLLVHGHSRRGEVGIAIDYACRRLALDPLDEPTHRLLMHLYTHNGQTAAALRQYQECVHILDRELGAPPEAETIDLYEAIRTRRLPSQELRPAIPVLPSLSARHNLPAQTSLFLGREDEIAAVLQRLIAPECRLLSIVGAGGVGKTRLALAVAEQALDRFAGVYFVPLAGVDNPRAMPMAIADALSLPATVNGNSRRDHLLSFLSQQHLLLVLDNFEHLIEGAAFLSEILAAAPDVKLLVTSRQLLNLHEEWRYPLAGLPYPGPDERATDVVYPAIELFRQRAMQTDPDFALAQHDPAVTALCRRLEGLPLGIELAAALVRVLSPAQIDEALTHNLDVLSSAARNMPAGHRSLRAVFERSWRLLPDEIQVALRALSIFHSSFDREAAFAVAGLTLPMLTDLVDQSLVRHLPQDRYDLHELMRQFVAEKLKAAPGEQAATSQRHCRHFCGRLARMSWCFEPEKQADGFQHRTFSERISADLDNYRAAWRWSVAHMDSEAMRQAMNVLAEYLPVEEGWHLFDEAITAVQSTDALPADEAEALVAALILRRSYCWRWDLLPESAAALSQSLAILRRADPQNDVDISANLIWLGITIASLGRNDEGAVLIDEGINLFHSHDHQVGTAWGLNFRGLLEAGRGRLVAAREFLEQSMALFELCNNWRWRAVSRANLADVALLQGNFQRARQLYEQSLLEEGDARPELLKNLGESYAALGELDRAEACFAQAEILYARAGMPYGMSLAYMMTPGVVARLRGDLAEAERLLVGSVSTARQVGFDQRIATNLHNLARLRHTQQRYDEAMALLDEALTISRRIDFRFATSLVLCQLGHTATALNRPEAPTYYSEALQIALADEIDRVSTDVIRGIARRLATQGRLEEAVSLLALVVDHPASDYETRQKAQTLLSELAAELPSNRFTLAMYQGRHEDLHQTVARLLSGELPSPAPSIP